MIELYHQGWRVKEIATEFSVKKDVIIGVLDRASIKRRSLSESKQKYAIDSNFFDAIDTEQKAYWYGFIAADGWVCIACQKYSVNIELKGSDKSHLLKFRSDINSTHPILERTQTVKGKTYPSCRVAIGNKHMANRLIDLGIVPGKTAIFTFPNIDVSFYRHFIRGYVDGDGSFSLSRGRKVTHKPALNFSVVGNAKLLKDFQDILMDACNLNRTKIIKHHRKTIYSLCYGGNNQVPRILEYFYKDAVVYLDRKAKYYFDWLQSKQ